MVDQKTKIVAFGITDKGKERYSNEDTYYISPSLNIFGVFDGVGGNTGGGVASYTASETLKNQYKNIEKSSDFKKDLFALVSGIDKDIEKLESENPKLKGMGCTATIGAIEENNEVLTLHLIEIGDSRAYLFRNNRLIQLGIDHSWYNLQIKNNQKFDGADLTRYKNTITSSLGSLNTDFGLDYYKINLEVDDMIFLSSDGIHSYLPHEDFSNYIRTYREKSRNIDTAASGLSELTTDLVADVNNRGGIDNASVIAISLCCRQKIPEKNPINGYSKYWIIGDHSGKLSNPVVLNNYPYSDIPKESFLTSSSGKCFYLKDKQQFNKYFKVSENGLIIDKSNNLQTSKKNKTKSNASKNGMLYASILLVVTIVGFKFIPNDIKSVITKLPGDKNISENSDSINNPKNENSQTINQKNNKTEKTPDLDITNTETGIFADDQFQVMNKLSVEQINEINNDGIKNLKIIYSGKHKDKSKYQSIIIDNIELYLEGIKNSKGIEGSLQNSLHLNLILSYMGNPNSLELKKQYAININKSINYINSSQSIDPYAKTVAGIANLITGDSKEISYSLLIDSVKTNNQYYFDNLLLAEFIQNETFDLFSLNKLGNDFIGSSKKQSTLKILGEILQSDVLYFKKFKPEKEYFYLDDLNKIHHFTNSENLYANYLDKEDIKHFNCYINFMKTISNSKCKNILSVLSKPIISFSINETKYAILQKIYELRSAINYFDNDKSVELIDYLKKNQIGKRFGAYVSFAEAKVLEEGGEDISIILDKLGQAIKLDPNFMPSKLALENGSTKNIKL